MEVAAGAVSRSGRLNKPVPDHLPKEDPATQEMRLRHWQDVLHKLDGIPRAQLSPEEQINYDVYRPEIEDFVADQKFRDYEMPANSDSAFWTDFGYTARRPFKTVTDYKNWIAQMRDIPRYFREEIDEHASGAGARLHAAARSLCKDARNRSRPSREGKPEDNLLYTPFREPMVGVEPSDQDEAQSAKPRRSFARSCSRPTRTCSNFSATNTCRTRARRWRPKRCRTAKRITAENSRVHNPRSFARRNSSDRASRKSRTCTRRWST